MRHRKVGRKLNRSKGHRRALFSSLVTALLKHEKIQTTEAKAKELRRFAEPIITLGKKGSLHARRQAAKLVRDKEVLQKLFSELGPRYSNRPGGYTRIIKIGNRRGDNAAMCVIELVEDEMEDSKL